MGDQLMTKNKEAFIKAYKDCVAVADEQELRNFLKDDEAGIDGNELYDKYPSTYTSIMDAWTLWDRAITFAKESQK
jgi:hypothetical protein